MYRSITGWRPLAIGLALYFTAAAGVLVVQAATGPVPWTFTILWLCAYAWVMPQVLLRFAYQLELRDGIVRWKTAVRSGHFAVNDVRSVRPYRWGRNAEVVELRNGQKLFVMIMRGFREFAADLAENAPFAQIEVGRFTQTAERRPGSKNYYERDH
jgi:hypothetical protein